MVNTQINKGPVEELPIREKISIDQQNSINNQIREDNRIREKSFDKIPTGVTQTSRFEPESTEHVATILITKL